MQGFIKKIFLGGNGEKNKDSFYPNAASTVVIQQQVIFKVFRITIAHPANKNLKHWLICVPNMIFFVTFQLKRHLSVKFDGTERSFVDWFDALTLTTNCGRRVPVSILYINSSYFL